MTHSQTAVLPPPPRQIMGDTAFQMLAERLHDETGIVLSEAKRGLAVSRLSRRVRALGLVDFDAYCKVLNGPNGASELHEMVLLLTTNVTRFFREPHHFETLRSNVLPALITRAKGGGRVRIWSAGCSSGEEAYSIAMTILDLEPQAVDLDIQILATDIDSNVVKVGTTARYKLNNEDFDEHPILRRFTHGVSNKAQCYEMSAPARKLVQFGQLNLMHPWPMRGKFDVVFCRNVVIYFSTETQQDLWPRFANALNQGGHLMIGHSERVTGPASKDLQSAGVTHYMLNARTG